MDVDPADRHQDQDGQAEPEQHGDIAACVGPESAEKGPQAVKDG
jgi:hypothetical protein